MVATPLQTVHRTGHRPDEHQILADLVAETEAAAVVVGLPLSLDGSTGPAAKNVLSEVKALRKVLGVPVTTHDERFSTVEAEDQLDRGGVRGRRRRAVIDQSAATVILQSWLDGRRGQDQHDNTAPNPEG